MGSLGHSVNQANGENKFIYLKKKKKDSAKNIGERWFILDPDTEEPDHGKWERNIPCNCCMSSWSEERTHESVGQQDVNLEGRWEWGKSAGRLGHAYHTWWDTVVRGNKEWSPWHGGGVSEVLGHSPSPIWHTWHSGHWELRCRWRVSGRYCGQDEGGRNSSWPSELECGFHSNTYSWGYIQQRSVLLCQGQFLLWNSGPLPWFSQCIN